MTDRDFEAVFTPDRPVVFTFDGYPGLIHRLTYRRPSQHNIHVRGYGSTATSIRRWNWPSATRPTASPWP